MGDELDVDLSVLDRRFDPNDEFRQRVRRSAGEVSRIVASGLIAEVGVAPRPGPARRRRRVAAAVSALAATGLIVAGLVARDTRDSGETRVETAPPVSTAPAVTSIAALTPASTSPPSPVPRWEVLSSDVTGFAPGTQITGLVRFRGELVTVGRVFMAGEPMPLRVWRSVDGRSWSDVPIDDPRAAENRFETTAMIIEDQLVISFVGSSYGWERMSSVDLQTWTFAPISSDVRPRWGREIEGGRLVSVSPLAYSDDGGLAWTPAVVDRPPFLGTPVVGALRGRRRTVGLGLRGASRR